MVASLKVLSAFLLAIFLPCMVWASGQDYASATEDKNQDKKEERRQPILSPPGVPLGPMMPVNPNRLRQHAVEEDLDQASE